MAPRLARNVEIIFAIFVVVIFCIILNKYYGKEISAEVSKYIGKIRTYAEYSRVENLAKGISVPERNGETENFIPILVYHGVIPGVSSNEEEFSLENFQEQMFELKKNGYQTISMQDFYRFVKEGTPVPDKSFVLTFDDGRKDSYYPVDPILKALDFTATMFVITNTFFPEKPSPYYLSVDELKAMVATGRWDLQSHGREDHGLIQVDQDGHKGRYMSNKKWLENEQRLESNEEYRDRIVSDLKSSKQDLYDVFGIEAIGYALPAGDYGHRTSNYSDAESVIQSVLHETYPMTFFQSNPDARIGYYRANYYEQGLDQYFFRRIKVLSSFSTEELLSILSASHEKKIPYYENFSNRDNWIHAWGDLNFHEEAMTLQNMDDSNSAAVFLDGTMRWKDYRFSVDAQLISGNRYNVLARVKNGRNFIGCSFEDETIKLFVVENEISKVIAIKSVPSFNVRQKNSLGIDVHDNAVQCLLNGKMIMKNTVSRSHDVGGVGLSVFSENKQTHAILDVLKNISVIESK